MEEFVAPEYNQVHQEQIVAGETTENRVKIPAVQEQVIFRGVPQVPIVERIQEQIVEPIEVLPHERVQQHTTKQIVHVPVTQIQEQSAVTGLVNPQIPITTVETSGRWFISSLERLCRTRVQPSPSGTICCNTTGSSYRSGNSIRLKFWLWRGSKNKLWRPSRWFHKIVFNSAPLHRLCKS